MQKTRAKINISDDGSLMWYYFWGSSRVNYNYKKICIIQPAYFSVASCCSMLSLEYGMEQISFTDGHPQLPVKAIISGGYDCIWFTSPIFAQVTILIVIA